MILNSSKMLNRTYSISGKIMHGEKRGSQIGFPTANINLKAKYFIKWRLCSYYLLLIIKNIMVLLI
jgi:FAD synthase